MQGHKFADHPFTTARILKPSRCLISDRKSFHGVWGGFFQINVCLRELPGNNNMAVKTEISISA
jgi:hypothetical protein